MHVRKIKSLALKENIQMVPRPTMIKKQGDNFVTEIDSSHEEDSGMATGCFSHC
jgi:hypothetical protein